MTEKQYTIIGISGIAVYLAYVVISFWIKEYWFIRLGMGLSTIFIVYFMCVFRVNKVLTIATLALMSWTIIYYHEIRGLIL